MIVHVRHLRAAKVCSRGTKIWFEENGLDFRDFVKNGIDAEVLRELNDPLGNRVLQEAENELGRE